LRFRALAASPVSAYSMNGSALIGVEVVTRTYTEYRNKKPVASGRPRPIQSMGTSWGARR
jgi:hypothetical protein